MPFFETNCAAGQSRSCPGDPEKRRAAFTLIELALAVFVMGVAVLGVFGLGRLGLTASTDAEAKANWAGIYTAVLFTYGHYCLERQAIANGIPTYVYYFTKDNGRLGCWHSGEMIYFYHNIPEKSRLYTAEDRALSDTIRGYIKNFAVSGDPNGEGLPVWESSKEAGSVMVLGDKVERETAPYLELYEILDEMYGF